MRATEEQHNARKCEMMEKCFECYAENGLTGTGIKALAAACGCTTGNLYSYFNSVDELIIESTAYCMEKVEDEIEILSIDDEDDGEEDEILNALDRYFEAPEPSDEEKKESDT